MIINLMETKLWLKIDGNEEDSILQMLINSAEKYLKNASENTFADDNEIAKLFCLVLVADWYENRELVGKVGEKIRYTIDSLLLQLSNCYESNETPNP